MHDLRDHRGKRLGRGGKYSCIKQRKSVRRWSRNEEVEGGVAISSITRVLMLLVRTRTSIGMGVSRR